MSGKSQFVETPSYTEQLLSVVAEWDKWRSSVENAVAGGAPVCDAGDTAAECRCGAPFFVIVLDPGG